jgi:hypothetical protein
MPGFVNKERVVFACGLALLLWEAVTFAQGPDALKDPPRPPRPKKVREAEKLLPIRVLGPGETLWKGGARNVFMPRQEFSDLPPASLPVPPAPPPAFVAGAPAPRPAAGAANQFRQSVISGTKIDIDTPPADDEDDG